MKLNTYESRTVHDVFVTVPTAEAVATIGMVGKLRALRLKLVRRDYVVSDRPLDLHFLELVSMEIATSGYAIHGFDLAFDEAASRRPRGDSAQVPRA